MTDPIVERFIGALEAERAISPSTSRAYRAAVARWLESTPWPPPRDGLARHVVALAATLSHASVIQHVAAIRAFLRWAVEVGELAPASVPTLPKMRARPAELPRVLDAESARRLLEAAAADKSPIGVRDRAIILALYATGAREAEIEALDRADVDLDAGTVRIVRGKGGKSRIVPMAPAALSALAAWLEIRPGPVEGALWRDLRSWDRLGRTGIVRALRRVSAAAGLEPVNPHALRHTCATAMLEGGADLRVIQVQLGHSTPATTARYAHVSDRHLRAAYSAAHPLAKEN